MNEDAVAQLAMNAIEKAFAVALAHLSGGQPFCIYGAGEVGRIVLHLCRKRNLQPAAFLDDLCEATEIDGVPVCFVKEGVERFSPGGIVLGSIRALDRMRANLKALPYEGDILSVEDANAHMRSPHVEYYVTPPEEIRVFKDRHAGQRAFVIGNGPSLLNTDPRRLMRRGEITFAANNIFLLKDFDPTYYAAIDRVLTQERAEEINALPWVKFFPHLVSGWITNGFFLHANHRDWPEAFSTDISVCLEIDFTVTFSLLQIAYYMGCDPIYLIGVDHTYIVDNGSCHQEEGVLTSVAEDKNHFHPGYFGRGYRWSKPRMEPLKACYQVALDAYTQAGRELLNATAGGALDVLPRVDFETLI